MDTSAIILGVAIAFLLLAAIVYATARIAEKRNPPIGDFITAGGIKLHYLSRGQGDPIVLLHGNTTMI